MYIQKQLYSSSFTINRFNVAQTTKDSRIYFRFFSIARPSRENQQNLLNLKSY